MKTIILRPHHILDILATYGQDKEFVPDQSGNAVHIVAKKILCDMEIPIRLHIGTDDICSPCNKLIGGKRCSNTLTQLDPPISMQDYNDELDKLLLNYLGIQPDTEMVTGEFYKIVSGKIPGIEKICTHPGENEVKKCEALRLGLMKLEL